MLFRIQHDLVDINTDYIQPNITVPVVTIVCIIFRHLKMYTSTHFTLIPSFSDWNWLPTSVTDAQTLQEFREGLSTTAIKLDQHQPVHV